MTKNITKFVAGILLGLGAAGIVAGCLNNTINEYESRFIEINNIPPSDCQYLHGSNMENKCYILNER